MLNASVLCNLSHVNAAVSCNLPHVGQICIMQLFTCWTHSYYATHHMWVISVSFKVSVHYWTLVILRNLFYLVKLKHFRVIEIVSSCLYLHICVRAYVRGGNQYRLGQSEWYHWADVDLHCTMSFIVDHCFLNQSWSTNHTLFTFYFFRCLTWL